MCSSPLCGWALRAQRIASDWAPNFAQLWYGYGAMNQETTSAWWEAIILPEGAAEPSPALCHSSLPGVWMFLIWMHLGSPVPGQSNRPQPSQADFSCSVENHFVLFSGVWWIELPARRKRETRTAALVSSDVATGWFYPRCVGWAGWGEQGVVSDLLDMFSWLDLFWTRQGKGLDSVL